jgi:hypothetical protein
LGVRLSLKVYEDEYKRMVLIARLIYSRQARVYIDETESVGDSIFDLIGWA